MPETSSTQSSTEAGTAAAFEVALAWLFVGIPLAWGVWEVAAKSLDLFTK